MQGYHVKVRSAEGEEERAQLLLVAMAATMTRVRRPAHAPGSSSDQAWRDWRPRRHKSRSDPKQEYVPHEGGLMEAAGGEVRLRGPAGAAGWCADGGLELLRAWLWPRRRLALLLWGLLEP